MNVGYLINDTAPKSLITYRATSNAPAANAGLSIGSVTVIKVLKLLLPKERAESSIEESILDIEDRTIK